MDPRELIQAIMDEDFISAKSMMNDLVMSTVADNIDELRQEVAANLFGCDECGEENIEEAWDKETKVSPQEKGEYEGRSIESLKKEYAKLKASGPHSKSSPEYGDMRELAFAIRAKTGWGSVQEMRGGTPAFHRYMAGGKPSGWASPAGKDYDKDGKVEPPKDEVLGSRINAAVRAGKMTPEQAKRTKSKGKYG